MKKSQADNLRILMVRPSALGDVCRTVPVLVTLRRAFPEAVIDWVVRDAFAEAVSSHPALNEVIAFPRESVGNVWRMMRAIRGRHYDVVIDLQGLARSGLVTWWSGASDRVGFANAREGAALAYRRDRRFAIDASMHTVDRMLGLIGAAWPEIEISHDMRLHVAKNDRAVVRDGRGMESCGGGWGGVGGGVRALSRKRLGGTVGGAVGGGGYAWGGYACLAPTAQWLCKCWPIERYAEIGKRLLAEHDAIEKVVVIAAPSERERVRPLLDALGDRAVCPTTTVGQMMALIEGCRVLVCNDSAALHMGVGLDRPLVAIFGPTDPALVGPYRRDGDVVQPANINVDDMTNYRRRREDQSLIARVDVAQVWESVVERLP